MVNHILKGFAIFKENRIEQGLTLFTITFMMFLGFLFLLINKNIDYQLTKNKENIKLIAIWNKAYTKKQIEKEWKEIKKLPSVLYIKTYHPEDALKLILKKISPSDKLEWLIKDNPIPPSAIVVLKKLEGGNVNQIKKDIKFIRSIKGIKVLNLRKINFSFWEKMGIIKRLLILMLVFLGIILGFVTSNTFRMSLLAKKEEIEVLWLIGATRSYIILPNLLGVVVHVILAGTISLTMIFYLYKFLNNLLGAPPFWFEIKFLQPLEIVIFFFFILVVSLITTFINCLVQFESKIK